MSQEQLFLLWGTLPPLTSEGDLNLDRFNYAGSHQKTLISSIIIRFMYLFRMCLNFTLHLSGTCSPKRLIINCLHQFNFSHVGPIRILICWYVYTSSKSHCCLSSFSPARFSKKSTEQMKKVPTIILSVSYKGVKFIDATNKVTHRCSLSAMTLVSNTLKRSGF